MTMLIRHRREEQGKGFEAHIQIFMMLFTLMLFSWWLLTDFAMSKDARVFVNADLTQIEYNRLARHLTGKKRPSVLRQELMQLAWIEKAIIRRNERGDILLTILTEDLIAYLPGKGYYLSNGKFIETELDRTQNIPIIKSVLSVGAIEEPVRILPDLTDVLAKQHLVPFEYRIGRGGDLRVLLRNGPELIFGYRSHTSRLEVADRFLARYRQELNKIRRIDLRYENALAVNWKHGGNRNE